MFFNVGYFVFRKKKSILFQCQLWPAIILAQHSEKPSIVQLVKSVTTYIHSVDSWTITWPSLDQSVLDRADDLLEGLVGPSEEEKQEAWGEVEKKGEKNKMDYRRLCDLLCDQAGEIFLKEFS